MHERLMTYRVFLTIFILSTLVSAQIKWDTSFSQRSFQLLLTKPNFSGDSGADALTGTAIFRYHHHFTNAPNLIIEVPVAYAGGSPNLNNQGAEPDPEGNIYLGENYDYSAASSSQASIGNIYIGFSNQEVESSVYMEYGISIPTASKFSSSNGAASAAGLLSNYVDEAQRFSPEFFSINFSIEGHNLRGENGLLHIGVGTELWVPLRDKFADPEFFLKYGFYLGQRRDGIQILAGISGRLMMSRSPDFLKDQLTNQFMLGLDFKNIYLQPGIHLYRPFGEKLTQHTNWALRFSLRYHFLN